MSKLYTDLVHFIVKKSCFSWNFKKMKILDFFHLQTFQAKIRGFLSESSGLDLNCHVLEYLMMYLFDFTDTITKVTIHLSFFEHISQTVLV